MTNTTISTLDSAKSFPSGGKKLVVSADREPQIWEWGVDESLWNPDRSRYAGRPPPLPGCGGKPYEDNPDLMECMKRADEWFAKRLDMTEDEKKQERRAMDAYLETLEPLDDEIPDEILDGINT